MDLTNMLKQFVALQTESINTLKQLYLDVQQNETDIENNQIAVDEANTALEASKQQKVVLLNKITQKEAMLEQCNFRLGVLAEQLEFLTEVTQAAETTTVVPPVEENTGSGT